MSGDKKKKILFVITKSNWGGAQRYLYDLAVGLADEGYDVSVALGAGRPAGESRQQAGGELVQKLHSAGIKKIYGLASGRDVRIFEELKTFLALLRIIWLENPDVIHLNSSKIGGVGAAAAWLLRVPKIIFTAHGWAYDEDRPNWQRRLILFFSRLSTLFHHQVICVSEHSKRSGQQLGGGYKKCITIHNAIKEIDFYPAREARRFFKEHFKIMPSRGAIWIGTISELTKNKGLAYLIDAVSMLESKNWICLIIGAGELRDQLTRQIKARSLEKQIFILDPLPDAARYLKAFDIFALSSVKEGLPYVLLEAGSAGLAVAASDVGGIPEIIENEKTGLLAPAKYRKVLAGQLERLIKDKLLRRNLGEALQKKIASDFKFDVMFERTKEVYNRK